MPDYRPAGSTRNWSTETRKVAEELEKKFGVKCSTYPGHGRTGEAWGIDAWIAPFRSRANAGQEALGDRIQLYLERNWRRLGVDYLIWWNWMKEDAGTNWFDYSPWSRPASEGGWKGGDPNLNTRRHFDHFHLQTTPGFTYRPKPSAVSARFSAEHLRRIMPNLSLDAANAYMVHLRPALANAKINTRNRLAYWMGQVAYESGELRYWRELGSDSYLESKPYWPYIGRCPAQLTWRENYAACGKGIGLNLLERPGLIERPKHGFKAACWFWNSRDLSRYADHPSTASFNEIMRLWLGTANHPSWQPRADYTNRAFAVLPENMTL
jgi:putative chitinase